MSLYAPVKPVMVDKLPVRMRADEMHQARSAARIRGLTLSAFVREAIAQAAASVANDGDDRPRAA